MQDIRTLQIIGSKKLGGAEGFFIRLHEAFNRAEGLSSVAVTPPSSALNASLSPPVETRAMRSVYDPFSRLALARLVRRSRPDIVQTWMGRATRSVRLSPARLPVHVARLGGFYEPGRYRHAHALVGNTRAICDFLVRSGIPASRISCIGNFVTMPAPASEFQLQALRRERGIPADALIVFSLGRLHENKGFDTLIRAVERLPSVAGGRPVHLLLAGDGPLKTELQTQARDSGAASRIHWLGWQPNPSPYFYLADLMVCPSRHEPLGNVLLEAWAHRCPVVSTRTHGALELIEDGVSGLLCDIDDPEQMTAQIQTLLSAAPSQREGLIEQGLRTLDARFSERAIVQAYRGLYRQLLEKFR
ncbi:glycosyltransferase [Thioalkalivibrio sp. ALJT]|uniref:glycosyltransferase n=1 Tax=Thioalkalivibrio sp. ALJT TaxID=1158146 RepID=UPI000377ECDB|nr:glycosyltransferase [Thioalkalivibrio sp. ALJT]